MNGPERIRALEATLLGLRAQLDRTTAALGSTPGNTSLVIERVNVMKRILLAQSELDRLRLASVKK